MGRFYNRGTTQIALQIHRTPCFSLTQKATERATESSPHQLKSYTIKICLPAFTCPGSLRNKWFYCLFFTAFNYIFILF